MLIRNLMKHDVQLFALATLNTFHLSSLEINQEVALGDLRDDITSEFEDLNLQDTKKARLDHFEVSGAGLNDYSEKLLCLDGHRKVLYGIRHMGGSRDVPFVQFTPSFPIGSKSEALEIYKAIKSELKVFNPLYVSFWTKSKIDSDFIGSVYMVSTSDKLKALTPWEQESAIRFKDISDDSYYDWYKKGYDEFHVDFPNLRQKVTVNSANSMKNSLEQGLIKYIFIDGEKIGLIAAEKNKLLGHDGIYFHEIYYSLGFLHP